MTGEVIEKIKAALPDKTDRPFLIALDGRCASGKTTLASALREATGCGVIHMDDFFLRPEQRTEERLRQPGGNVDSERFLQEVLLPLKRGEPFAYRPYDCRTRGFKEPVGVEPERLMLIEGSYSCHPMLWDYYDLHIFLTVSPKEQLRRIENRGGLAALDSFISKWIPLEERYFEAFSVKERCELCFDTEGAE